MEKHAYLVMAHADKPLLDHLISQLDDERNDIYVHIDAKSPSSLMDLHTSKASIHVLRDRISTYWGAFSTTQTIYALLKAARADGHHSYYHLLSGVDIPVKTQDYIHSFCAEHDGAEYVGFAPAPADVVKLRMHWYLFPNHFKKPTKVMKVLEKVSMWIQDRFHHEWEQYQICKGSTWWSISEALADKMIADEDWVKHIYGHTFSADESFPQTLVWNSEFKDKVFDIREKSRGNMRYLRWEKDHPYLLEKEWADEMIASRDFFARKCNSLEVSEYVAQRLKELNDK